MSKRALIYTAILYISLFSSVIKSQNSNFIVKEIYPYNLNATASFLSLTNTGIKKYAYFSFEFNKEKIIDIAYFKISTDSAIYQSNIQYLFIEKKVDEIKKEDLEGNNIYYNYIKGFNFRKEKTEQGFDSYIKMEKYCGCNKNTLIIRIDVEKLKGDISVENLKNFPQDNSLNKNILINSNYPNNYNAINNNGKNNNYPNNYNGINNNYHGMNNNHQNNNYGRSDHFFNDHNSVINNEQRYSNNDIHNKYNHYHKEWRYHSHDKIQEPQPFKIVYGITMAQIWFIILILYCIINRRKKNTQYAVGINNSV